MVRSHHQLTLKIVLHESDLKRFADGGVHEATRCLLTDVHASTTYPELVHAVKARCGTLLPEGDELVLYWLDQEIPKKVNYVHNY